MPPAQRDTHGATSGSALGKDRMPLSTFELLLLRNSSQIEQLDKFLTFLTTFLPGQTPSMELAGEAIVSSSAILQTYKSYIINKVLHDSKRTLGSRYMDAEYAAHKEYKVLAYLLSVLKSTELFIEMSAAHVKGEKGRWRAVLSLEALKSALRLVMLGISQRALPSPVPVHDVTVDQEELTTMLTSLPAKQALPMNQAQAATEVLPGDGVRKSTSAQSNSNAQLASKFEFSLNTTGSNFRSALRPPEIDRLRPPLQLVRKLPPALALSEVLVILRPLLYATLLYRYRSRRRDWAPWLIGIAFEAAARELAARALDADPKRRTGLEKEIYKSRSSDMVWWLMRGAMYEQHTRALLMGVAERLLRVPVIGLGGRLLQDGLYLFDEYYFASATM